jgi:hypothetical protein
MSENLKVKDHLGDLGVDEMIILKWALKTRIWGLDWIHSSSGLL